MNVELRIFSPRWGHEDTYMVQLEQDFMEIAMQTRIARADWSENTDPQWSGESLERIMRNDSIYPPSVMQSLFEHAWRSWRNGEIPSEDVDTELQSLAEWLNTITRSKPNSEFWSRYF